MLDCFVCQTVLYTRLFCMLDCFVCQTVTVLYARLFCMPDFCMPDCFVCQTVLYVCWLLDVPAIKCTQDPLVLDRSDENFICCHTEDADQMCHLIQTQHTGTRPTCPSTVQIFLGQVSIFQMSVNTCAETIKSILNEKKIAFQTGDRAERKRCRQN